jgi:hypothetical protein
MRNLDSLTAEKLLSITRPESLFTKSLYEAKQEYRALARRWHPDGAGSPDAHKVFAHVVQLYQQALNKILDGKWVEPGEKAEEERPGTKTFRLMDGSLKTLNYLTERTFELGHMYVADNFVAFEVNHEFSDLFRNGRAQIRCLKYKDDDMAVEMARYLPQVADEFRTADTRVLAIRKTPDQLLLADVLAHYGEGLMQLEHIGWILNVLYNLACYLQWLGVAHNAFSPETVFISPVRHSGMLLGGWWYATEFDERLNALPDRTVKYIPAEIIERRLAAPHTDLELIKAIGREILGDADGTSLCLNENLPFDLVDFLQQPSSGLATQDYAAWKYGALPAVFGTPRFVTMHLDTTALYKEA